MTGTLATADGSSPDRTAEGSLDSGSAVYDADVSAVYDLFYRGRGQDFVAEVAAVVRVVLERRPDAGSLLDVGCGTGEHLRAFAERFPDVAGLEMSEAMCVVARAKLPLAPVLQGDMRDFELGRSFDAITCLTSTLGYSSGTDELAGAVTAMVRHLTAGGVVVVDPWWSPAAFLDRHVAHDVVSDGSRTVARLSHSIRTGMSVRHEAHYLIADAGSGIRHVTHVQPLTLFSPGEYLDAIEGAGCVAAHVRAPEFAARGLFVGVRQ
jgi:SAM-dependent methyltransferase